jgi:trigger factor
VKLDVKELPELDDTFVKPFGFENVSAFHDAVRENLKNEKEIREKETQRTKILDEVVAKAKVQYPAMLREYEKDEMRSRIETDLQRMGTTFENYLTQTKKTVEDLRKEWEEPADKRAKTRLLLAEIARAENITADEHKVEHELEHAVKHYPSANKDSLKMNIAHALKNEAVIEFLESQK